jgi:hypothetical protein
VRKDSFSDCYQYRCAQDLQTAVPGAAVAGVVQIRGPDGAWRSCDSAGKTFAVPGYAGVVTCPLDRSLCLRSCLSGVCTPATPAVPAAPAPASFSLSLQVRAAYALADFDEPVRLRFRRSFAALACFCAGGCCVNESQVSLSAQEDSGGGRRAGGGLLVNVTIAGAPSADAAASLASNLTADRINVALQAEGLDAINVTSPAVVVRVLVSAAPTTTAAPATAVQTAPRTTAAVIVTPSPSVANCGQRQGPGSPGLVVGGLAVGAAMGLWMARSTAASAAGF